MIMLKNTCLPPMIMLTNTCLSPMILLTITCLSPMIMLTNNVFVTHDYAYKCTNWIRSYTPPRRNKQRERLYYQNLLSDRERDATQGWENIWKLGMILLNLFPYLHLNKLFISTGRGQIFHSFRFNLPVKISILDKIVMCLIVPACSY